MNTTFITSISIYVHKMNWDKDPSLLQRILVCVKVINPWEKLYGKPVSDYKRCLVDVIEASFCVKEPGFRE